MSEPPIESEPFSPSDLLNPSPQQLSRMWQRIEALEQSVNHLTTSDEAQRQLIGTLYQEKQEAEKLSEQAEQRATRFDRLAKVLILSLVLTVFVFDGRVQQNNNGRIEFEIRTKEIPLVVAAGYGLAVLTIVLDKQQITALAETLKSLVGR